MAVGRINFDTNDTDGYYEKPVTLPAAAVWNMDQFLMDYLASALTWLLEESNADWTATGEMCGKSSLYEDMIEARNLACSYNNDATHYSEIWDEGTKCLRLIADLGVYNLWD